MAWYSHLFQNFPQFIVIHTVKGFGIVNKAEIDVFLELIFDKYLCKYLSLYGKTLNNIIIPMVRALVFYKYIEFLKEIKKIDDLLVCVFNWWGKEI